MEKTYNMNKEEEIRHQEELNATLEQIKAFNNDSDKSKFYIDIPIWRLAIEGISAFMLAIFVGMGLAVLYKIIAQ